jgi:hypothetical protein
MDRQARIERISQMEDRYDELTRVLAALEEAVDEYVDFKDELEVLKDYMASGEWKEDYEADEAGLVPADLKRGILSEDGLYNLLHDADTILVRARETLCGKDAAD